MSVFWYQFPIFVKEEYYEMEELFAIPKISFGKPLKTETRETRNIFWLVIYHSKYNGKREITRLLLR